MKLTNLTAAGMIIAMSAGFAATAFAEGGEVVCYSECDDDPPTKPKGNNGWGNGMDGDNPGTPKGGTADTKMNDVIWEKFDGKFDGR